MPPKNFIISAHGNYDTISGVTPLFVVPFDTTVVFFSNHKTDINAEFMSFTSIPDPRDREYGSSDPGAIIYESSGIIPDYRLNFSGKFNEDSGFSTGIINSKNIYSSYLNIEGRKEIEEIVTSSHDNTIIENIFNKKMSLSDSIKIIRKKITGKIVIYCVICRADDDSLLDPVIVDNRIFKNTSQSINKYDFSQVSYDGLKSNLKHRIIESYFTKDIIKMINDNEIDVSTFKTIYELLTTNTISIDCFSKVIAIEKEKLRNKSKSLAGNETACKCGLLLEKICRRPDIFLDTNFKIEHAKFKGTVMIDQIIACCDKLLNASVITDKLQRNIDETFKQYIF